MTDTSRLPQDSPGVAVPSQPERQDGEGGKADSVHLFIGAIGSLLPREELKNSIRVTPRGVFVEERGFHRLVEAYQLWLKNQTGGEVTKSTDKCIKRLFDTLQPPQYYLVEGKQCLLGFLVKCSIEQPQRYGIPFYLGSLLDTREYLHPRDPFLASMKNVEIFHKPLGLELKVPFKGKSIRLPAEVLKDFAALAQNSSKLLEKNPQAGRSLRDSLMVVIRLLGKTREISDKEPLLIPSRYRNKKDLKYFGLGSLVFVTERGGVLAGCYELRGKNFVLLVRNEVELSARAARGRQIGAIELPPRRSRFVGAIQVKHDRYWLHPRAFREFIDQAPHAPSLRESFSGPFTIFDCLKKMPFVFAAAGSADQRQVAAYLAKPAPRGARFRVKDDWIFVILGKNEVVSCINKRRPQRRGR